MAQPELAASALLSLERIIEEILRMFEIHVQFLSAIQEGDGLRQQGVSNESLHRWLHEQVATLLDAAVQQGEAGPLDVEFTASTLMAVLAPARFVFLQQQGFSRARIAAGIRRIFIEGLHQPPNHQGSSAW